MRLRKTDVCKHLGCAWNGTHCSGGVELSWGVKWNELHMLVPRAAPKSKRAKRAAERRAGEAGVVPDWQPPMMPRSIYWPPPPPVGVGIQP